MNSRSLLLLSLALNVALGGVIAYQATHKPEPPPAAASAPTGSPAPRVARKDKEVVSVTVTNQTVKTINWQSVESDDYKKYIANLRSIGCPEKTIKDIIVADVNELFDARRKTLTGNTNKFQYWKTGGNPFAQMVDPEKVQKRIELQNEKRALLTDLLGSTPEEKPDMFAMMGGVNPFEQMLDFLSPAKQTQLMDAFQKVQAKAMKTMGNGVRDDDDRKEMMKVQREGEAELAKILTPQEKEEFDMRMSNTAMQLRFSLTSFEPTEQEFRDLVKTKKKFDDEFGAFGMASEDKAEREKRAAAQKDLDEKLKTSLGAERFTEYQRAQDYEFQNLFRVTQKQNLPKEAAAKAWDMTKIAEEQANKLRSNTTLSNDERQSALQAIRAETEKSLTTTLGEKGYSAYMKQGGWRIKNIAPDPPQPKPTGAP